MLFRDEMTRVALAAGQRFIELGFRIRVQSRSTRVHRPRLQEVIGILNRGLPRQRVALSPEPLDDVHVVTMDPTANPQPAGGQEADRVYDESVLFPPPTRFSFPRPLQLIVGTMRATVRRDDAVSVGVLIEEEHLSRRLHNFDRWAHAWDACRHAGVYGISSVPLLVQPLNNVPVLRPVPRPILVHSPE